MNRSISKIRHIQETNEKLEKRFISEQKNEIPQEDQEDDSFIPWVTLKKPLKIMLSSGGPISWHGVELKDGKLLVDITHVFENPEGCMFKGKERNWQYFSYLDFPCDSNVIKMGRKPGVMEQTWKLSDVAAKLLGDTCGCNEYVKTGASSSQDYV